MKGKQIAMDSALADLDRYELERERRETEAVKASLDEKYIRMNAQQLLDQPDGSVVIIGQNFFRNGHYTWHFYRTVMTFNENRSRGKYSIFVQADNAEWPDIPPWAQVVNHEDEPHEIHFYPEHIHWRTGEVVEPITPWWVKEWRNG